MRKAIIKRVKTRTGIKARVELRNNGGLVECTQLISLKSAMRRADAWERIEEDGDKGGLKC